MRLEWNNFHDSFVKRKDTNSQLVNCSLLWKTLLTWNYEVEYKLKLISVHAAPEGDPEL